MATDTRNPTSEVAVGGTWSGTNRHLLVDDYPDTTGADVTTCSAAGVIQFGFSAFAIPAGSTAISVQVKYYDSKNGTQSSACGGSIRCNDTTNRNATTHNPANATWTSRSDNWANNPKSSAAWTVADVNGSGTNGLTAFGINVSDASPTVAISSVQLQVTYTPPATLALSVTEAADSFSANTTAKWALALASTEAKDAFSAAVDVQAGASLALSGTESADSFAANSTAQWGLTLSSNEAADTITAAVSASWEVALAVTDGGDTFSAAAQVLPVLTLELAVTDPVDMLAGETQVLPVLAADLAVNEPTDTLAGTADVLIAAELLATEAKDNFSADLALLIEAALNITESKDALASIVTIYGAPEVALDVVEGADFFALDVNNDVPIATPDIPRRGAPVTYSISSFEGNNVSNRQRYTPPTQLPQRLLETPLVNPQTGHVQDWTWKQFFQKLATPVQVQNLTTGTHAQRLVMDVGSLVPGSMFFETDRTLYYIAHSGRWSYSSGMMQVLRKNLPTDLQLTDAGVLAYITDFFHILRWIGNGWNWGPGEAQSGFVASFAIAPPENSGWVAADGSDNVPVLNGDGTVDFVTVPNVSGSYFRQ